MSIGPLGGIVASVAGSPASQVGATETERRHEISASATRVDADRRNERAAGIGETTQNDASDERDADGRRMFEEPLGDRAKQQHESHDAENQAEIVAKDPAGIIGTGIDLMG